MAIFFEIEHFLNRSFFLFLKNEQIRAVQKNGDIHRNWPHFYACAVFMHATFLWVIFMKTTKNVLLTFFRSARSAPSHRTRRYVHPVSCPTSSTIALNAQLNDRRHAPLRPSQHHARSVPHALRYRRLTCRPQTTLKKDHNVSAPRPCAPSLRRRSRTTQLFAHRP